MLLGLAACQHGIQNNDAVRQGVIDHLVKNQYNMSAMDVKVGTVTFNGNKADALVTTSLKANGGMPMSFKYHLEQQDNKWVVVGRDSGAHDGEVAPTKGGAPPISPDAANPHGGGGGHMPSPADLPPAKK